MGILGHAYALLLGRWIVDDLELDWVVSLFVFAMIYFLIGVLTCIIVPEKRIETDAEEDNQSVLEKTRQILKTLKNYYKRQASNVILLMEYCFIDSQGAMIVYWVPFFFMKVGFGFDATWVALSYPIGVAIGSFSTSPLINYFSNYANLITTFILFLECICAGIFWFIDLKEENLIIFVVLLGLASVFWIGPYTRLAQGDVIDRVKSSKEKYLAVNSMRMGTEILSAIYTLIIGFIMEMNPRNFLFFLTINPVIGLILHIIRIVREKRERAAAEEKKEPEQSQKGLEA